MLFFFLHLAEQTGRNDEQNTIIAQNIWIHSILTVVTNMLSVGVSKKRAEWLTV